MGIMEKKKDGDNEKEERMGIMEKKKDEDMEEERMRTWRKRDKDGRRKMRNMEKERITFHLPRRIRRKR